jgi:hypothetical protein
MPCSLSCIWKYQEDESCFGLVKRSTEDPRLAHLTEFALALPEATRQIYGSPAQFLVRRKIFAYFLQSHHGDVLVAVTCKVSYGDNKTLAEAGLADSIFPRSTD